MELKKAKEIISDEISNICDSELSEAWGTVQQKLDRLQNENEIKDEYLKLIIGLGFDYDGFEKSEDLKMLINDLVCYARKALNNADFWEGVNGD